MSQNLNFLFTQACRDKQSKKKDMCLIRDFIQTSKKIMQVHFLYWELRILNKKDNYSTKFFGH